MYFNSNRLTGFLLVLASLIAVGCSETPNEPIVIEGVPPVAYRSDFKYKQLNKPYNSNLSNIKRKAYSGAHDTVWGRMLSLYALPEVSNERVDRQLNWYLDHPDYIARIQERAAPYMHLILDEIEAKNLPGELALLPVVESAFIAEAYSRSDASGLWQFIPATGRLFGLKQNSWYDGRRDVYASTKAATSFLQDLGETFGGDWCLALASYNFGKGNIGKAIDRNEYNGRPTDYWSLDLPQETEDYVPRLLAIAKLFANADKYNIPLQRIPNQAYCAVVNVGSQLDLDVAAEMADMPLKSFLKLNPGFKKESTAPEGPHHLLLPVTRLQKFKENLAQLPYEERVDQRKHEEELFAERQRLAEQQRADRERREEQMQAQRERREEQQQAQRQRLEEQRDVQKERRAELLAQNQRQQAEAERKKRDAQLLAQSRREKQDKQHEQLVHNRHDDDSSFTGRYKVRAGETLSAIASRHHTTVKALRQANHLAANSVNSGTVLHVPASRNAEVIAEIKAVAKEVKKEAKNSNKPENSRFYTVQKGDTFWNVSQRFSLTPKTLAEWNGMSIKGALRSGQRLVVKGGGSSHSQPPQQLASSSSTRLIHYTVKKGDTLTQICKKFGVSAGDLRKSNSDLGKGLRSGLKLKIVTDGSHPTI
ncbi:Membrane-bound lytic murein transglycosylase D [Crenothrix polyspora]|uniref:Membrane-bound lytic murein transglycosylase D n=2 Tax=Crenothrix polyspora TaxID=360316 RepID=A0A1R4HG77_9GAMM|nr:Membrane-bound lytic murein transglycosylase D [Crenothrix polyspora]